MFFFIFLLAFLVGWHDMRQQVNDDRTRARHLLHISQEIVKLKLRLDDELLNIGKIRSHPWIDDDSSLNELMQRVHYEIDSIQDNRHVREEKRKESRHKSCFIFV